MGHLCTYLFLADVQIDGNRSKEVVFKEIDSLLSQLQNDKVKLLKPGVNFGYFLVAYAEQNIEICL